MRASKFWQFLGSNVISLLTILAGVLVIILSQIGFIGGNIVQSTILGLLVLLATSEIIESRGKLSQLEEDLAGLSTQLLQTTKGVQSKSFASNAEALEYAGQRMRNSNTSVEMASIDNRRSPESPSLKRYYAGRKTAEQSSSVKFRYVAVLHDERRLNKAYEYVANSKFHNYFAGFFVKPTEIPLMTFTIFDREEIFTRYPYKLGSDEGYVAIKSPEIVELFLAYYERLWDAAQKLSSEEDYQRLKEALNNQ